MSFGLFVSQIQKGVNAICATCNHHYEGLERGFGSCGDVTCKGPANGGKFDNYSGPIPREQFSKTCLRCLNPKIVLQVVIDTERQFGLCEEHKGTFDFLPTGDGVRATKPLVIPVTGIDV